MSDNTYFGSEDEDTQLTGITEEIEQPKLEQKPVRQTFPRKISPLIRNAIKAQLEAKKTQEVEAQVPENVQEKKIQVEQIMEKMKMEEDPTFICNGCYYCNWSKNAYSNAMCRANYYSGR
jgi:hypothetical protein